MLPPNISKWQKCEFNLFEYKFYILNTKCGGQNTSGTTGLQKMNQNCYVVTYNGKALLQLVFCPVICCLYIYLGT